MLLIVFPFSAHDRSEELPVVHAQVVGDIDARGLNPSQAADPTPPPQPTQLGEMGRFTPNSTMALGPTETPSGITDLPAFLRGGTTKTPEISIIGIGPGGGEGGGDATRYGLTVGGGAGPEFFGLGPSVPGVRSIVYVVDRSASMLLAFDHVKKELKRSIYALRRSQKFHVIFFNRGVLMECPTTRLVNAIEVNLVQLSKFLDAMDPPTGQTQPAPALRKALALEPDVIYFLSDGEFDAELIDRLDRWNDERRTRIFTIGFDNEYEGRKLLELIARQHNGEFKFVSEDDLP